MKLSQSQQIFSQNIAKLILKANSMGMNLTFGEAYRTEDQQRLYFFGKQVLTEGNYLVLADAKKRTQTMHSNHLRRLAIDFNFFIAGNLVYRHELITRLGNFWETLHPANRWGGNFENFYDAPHFEMNV
jgi:hypothetical protein